MSRNACTGQPWLAFGLLFLVHCATIGCGRQGAPARSPASPAKAGAATALPTIDLLSQLQLPRDQVRGDFRLVDGSLLVPSIDEIFAEMAASPT